jgi:hypothetical protein
LYFKIFFLYPINRRFTADKLLDFLKRLDQKVTIHSSPHKPGEPFQEAGFGL